MAAVTSGQPDDDTKCLRLKLAIVSRQFAHLDVGRFVDVGETVVQCHVRRRAVNCTHQQQRRCQAH